MMRIRGLLAPEPHLQTPPPPRGRCGPPARPSNKRAVRRGAGSLSASVPAWVTSPRPHRQPRQTGAGDKESRAGETHPQLPAADFHVALLDYVVKVEAMVGALGFPGSRAAVRRGSAQGSRCSRLPSSSRRRGRGRGGGADAGGVAGRPAGVERSAARRCEPRARPPRPRPHLRPAARRRRRPRPAPPGRRPPRRRGAGRSAPAPGGRPGRPTSARAPPPRGPRGGGARDACQTRSITAAPAPRSSCRPAPPRQPGLRCALPVAGFFPRAWLSTPRAAPR